MNQSIIAGMPELLELLREQRDEPIEQCVVLMTNAWLCDHTGRFLDDQQIVILVFNRESHPFVGLDDS
jgi:hypothetical protein